ncbi:MAG: acyl carrier protein [Candidatus Omnitrophica bacterium]|nr:acyl carrier protein [Candidatus Omnitrophota bacterium]
MGEKNTKEIEERICRRLASILSCPVSKIKSDLPLHTLGVDSLSFVELLVFIEKEFNIKLMESGIDKEDFKTVRSLATCISKIA